MAKKQIFTSIFDMDNVQNEDGLVEFGTATFKQKGVYKYTITASVTFRTKTSHLTRGLLSIWLGFGYGFETFYYGGEDLYSVGIPAADSSGVYFYNRAILTITNIGVFEKGETINLQGEIKGIGGTDVTPQNKKCVLIIEQI